jgi:hypothetical protein
VFDEGWADSVGVLLGVSCSVTRARQEDRKDGRSSVSSNSLHIKQFPTALKIGKIVILSKMLHGGDIWPK